MIQLPFMSDLQLLSYPFVGRVTVGCQQDCCCCAAAGVYRELCCAKHDTYLKLLLAYIDGRLLDLLVALMRRFLLHLLIP